MSYTTNSKIERVYKFRNLSENYLWCITGNDKVSGNSGILEYCRDEKDAFETLEAMHTSGEFYSLKARMAP